MVTIYALSVVTCIAVIAIIERQCKTAHRGDA
jgi:hypothetical protein